MNKFEEKATRQNHAWAWAIASQEAQPWDRRRLGMYEDTESDDLDYVEVYQNGRVTVYEGRWLGEILDAMEVPEGIFGIRICHDCPGCCSSQPQEVAYKFQR